MTLHSSRVDGVYCPHCHKDITDLCLDCLCRRHKKEEAKEMNWDWRKKADQLAD